MELDEELIETIKNNEIAMRILKSRYLPGLTGKHYHNPNPPYIASEQEIDEACRLLIDNDLFPIPIPKDEDFQSLVARILGVEEEYKTYRTQ